MASQDSQIDWTRWVDLASSRFGGQAIATNDDFFAAKENLVQAAAPLFVADRYTDRGKWMDGWESRRRREPGHDWCIVRLGLPGIPRGVIIDTAHFSGNEPPQCSVDACWSDLPDERISEASWQSLLPQVDIGPDQAHPFSIADAPACTHVRLNMYPDGGVARLRVHGQVKPDWSTVLAGAQPIDMAAIVHGGLVVDCSDAHFGQPNHLLMPGSPANMGDGWETRRRRGPGHDWAVIRLGRRGTIHRAEIDTTHFKGNAPARCALETCDIPQGEDLLVLPATVQWRPLLPESPLQADTLHIFDTQLCSTEPVTHVRFAIYPDGGVARLRLVGTPDA